MPNDNKARFGYQPTWDSQRNKQDEVAREVYERVHGEVEVPEPEQGWLCTDCGAESMGAIPRNCPECQSRNTVAKEY